MASYGQMRVAGESWRHAVTRNLALLRKDGALAQGVRFALSGVVVSIVYVSVTTVLSVISHLRFEVALALGWCAAVSVHFTLQRVFVWAHRDGFALPLGRQVGRYLLLACSQLGVTAASTGLLPSALGLPAEVVYLATAALLTLVNFLVFRNRVFHTGAPNLRPT